MKREIPVPFESSTSAPSDPSHNSGQGSILASIVARGVAISRYTPQGSMQPFGQETGTASDNTILATADVVSSFQSSSGTESASER